MTADDVTPVEIAVRGWTSIQTESEEAQKWESRSAIPPGRFRHALLLDVETRTDASQALTFGFCQHCIYLPDGKLVPVEEVCFYADELPETDPRGYAHLQEYVRMHPARAHSAPGYRPYRRTAKIALVSRTEFVRDYLLPLAAERLRLASSVSICRSTFPGGRSAGFPAGAVASPYVWRGMN